MNEQNLVLKGKLHLGAGVYPSLVSDDLLVTSPSSLACVENNQYNQWMGAGIAVPTEQPQFQAAGAEGGEPPGWWCSPCFAGNRKCVSWVCSSERWAHAALTAEFKSLVYLRNKNVKKFFAVSLLDLASGLNVEL